MYTLTYTNAMLRSRRVLIRLYLFIFYMESFPSEKTFRFDQTLLKSVFFIYLLMRMCGNHLH